MKTYIIIFAAIFAGLMGVASPSYALVQGSSHDFSGAGWSGGYDEICSACHTPHNANMTVSNSPLWDHDLSAVATYDLYKSSTLFAPMVQPDGISKLCLSCHDGTVALDAFGDRTPTAGAMTGDAAIGGDPEELSNDHPVSFQWEHNETTPFLPGGAGCSLACHGPGVVLPNPIAFFDNGVGGVNIECATCHDVHNNTPFQNLLRQTKVGSEICLACHITK
ncbi:MAG: cytochrome c3 family protein [Gammaproteobacteria bacterium]|nr:cytochrome c3 family protein [Gammaproteobacteria bacterium]